MKYFLQLIYVNKNALKRTCMRERKGARDRADKWPK
jgi:hypothetical protein